MDFCTDLCLNNEPFLDGQGHRGMVHATAWLVHHLRDDLRKLSGQYPDYRFVATGHSLGGSISELSTMQLRNEFPTMQCYASGTQACVTQKLATDSYDIVTTIHSLIKLQDEIRCFESRIEGNGGERDSEPKDCMEKQQHAKLEELQKALQKLDYFQ
ncbi:hypothetical protein PsorP6_006285 [Peronosclerospora sorghi]|uniref:Uncharacterized protein n=1 Tax=Peronosclerospora sorghi TaxID=230839 RepID=A0ACC0W5N8_9STRA|nr:hypothetical protein PsorP6_006285 [Peronosclerospora sorghi]